MSGVSLLEQKRKFQTRSSSKPRGSMYSSKFHTTTTKSWKRHSPFMLENCI